MKYTYLQGALWAVIYGLIALLPLGVVLVGPLPPARDFWVELSVALGFTGMAVMGLQFVLTGRFRRFAEGFGLDNMLLFHRHMGLVAFGLILVHPLVLFVHDPAYLSYLDPRPNLMRALALSAALGALTLLVVLTLWRKAFRIPYELWRVSHGLLALLVVLIGLAHILMVGYYVSPVWKQAVWVAMSVGAIYLLLHGRVVRPLRLKKRPWRVADVRAEGPRTWTVELEPDGHDGMDFEPGQFAWLIFGGSPFSMAQHPFSMSSSAAAPERVTFTIKELGDFTSTVKDIPLGTRAYVDGPHGAFTLTAEEMDEGATFFAAGVGITPVMSILRTLRDRGSRGSFQLFFANPDLEHTLFRDEIDGLGHELDLEVIPVLERPSEGWEGEEGFLRPELLERRLREDDGRRHYLVCGPKPMMDVVEGTLVSRGVAARRVLSERFDIA